MLPNLVIIGAMKCGTTSLHYYLSLHPEIVMSKQKELDFFIGKKNWDKGIEWYESQFQSKKAAKVFGEASPNYTNPVLFPGAAERMYQVIPDAKLIYLVRDPIDRMIAHYIHQYSYGHENRDIKQALTSTEKNVYLACSLYYTQISAFLRYFNSSQLLILSADNLRQNTSQALKEVFEFLSVSTSFESWQFNYQRHKSSRKRRKTPLGEKLSNSPIMKTLRKKVPYRFRWPIEEAIYHPLSHPIDRPQLDEDTYSCLKEMVADDVKKFKQLAECEFPFWSV